MKGKVRQTGFKALAILWLSLFLFCFVSAGMAQEKSEGKRSGMIVMKIEKQEVALGVSAGKAETVLNGEIVYRIIQTSKGMNFELDSLGLVATSIETKQGKSGTISVNLKPDGARSKYNPKNHTIESEFLAEVHYPLIDRMKGYISTPGSLMEPSGFCADNPALMSKKNCDNANNPLLTTHVPFILCIRNTNM